MPHNNQEKEDKEKEGMSKFFYKMAELSSILAVTSGYGLLFGVFADDIVTFFRYWVIYVVSVVLMTYVFSLLTQITE